MTDTPTPHRAASAEERDHLVGILRTAVRSHFDLYYIADAILIEMVAPLLDRITAAEARAEEAERETKRISSDHAYLCRIYETMEQEADQGDADLLALARMYGEACGQHWVKHHLLVGVVDQAESAEAATADRDQLATELAEARVDAETVSSLAGKLEADRDRLADEVARLSAELAAARSTGTGRSEAEAMRERAAGCADACRENGEAMAPLLSMTRNEMAVARKMANGIAAAIRAIPAQAAGGAPSPPPARGRDDADG
jgi:hypothetical protein